MRERACPYPTCVPCATSHTLCFLRFGFQRCSSTDELKSTKKSSSSSDGRKRTFWHLLANDFYYNYTFSERLFVSARCSIGNSLRDSRTDLWHRHRTRPSRVSLGVRKEVSVGKIGIEWSFELSEARQFVMFACSCNFLTFIALLLSKWHRIAWEWNIL